MGECDWMCACGGMENEGKRNIKIGVKVFSKEYCQSSYLPIMMRVARNLCTSFWEGVRRFQKRNTN